MFNRLVNIARNLGVAKGDGANGALYGTFDLSGEHIRGLVELVGPVPNGIIKVQAWRGCMPIAECAAQRATRGRQAHFVLPIEGRFSPEDLAREWVVIKAENGRGDNGILVMNGATRVELIRDHMGVAAERILDLDFTKGGNSRPFLGSGWSAAENLYTWATDEDSFISFAHARSEGSYLLRMKCGAFIAEYIKKQTMDVFVNDVHVAGFQEDLPSVCFREFRFDGACLANSGKGIVRLNHPNAARPSDVTGHHDTRRLAFSFIRLSLLRILEPSD